VSKHNGDKARFSKEQKKKLLRRARNLALRQSLTANTALHVDVARVAPISATENETPRIPDGKL
jgi:hypothetical protein